MGKEKISDSDIPLSLVSLLARDKMSENEEAILDVLISLSDSGMSSTYRSVSSATPRARCSVMGCQIDPFGPLSNFSIQPVLHNWCSKGCSMWDGGLKNPFLVSEVAAAGVFSC